MKCSQLINLATIEDISDRKIGKLMKKRFASITESLVCDIDGIRGMFGPLSNILEMGTQYLQHRFNTFIEAHGEPVRDTNGHILTYQIRPEQFQQVQRLDRITSSAKSAATIFPESLLVTIVSRYDAYLGKLIREMIETNPKLISGSDRTITYDSLIELGSIEAAKEYFIDKQIESIMRESHSEQFKWLEKRLDIPLTKNLDCWKDFIELTERRNLLVHCDGIVSRQYLLNCRHEQIATDQADIGSKIGVTKDYFMRSCDCVTEIAIKLSHVIWNKLIPGDIEYIESSFVDTGFSILNSARYKLAKNIFEFGVNDFGRFFSERTRLICTINLAQSHKWLGEKEACINCLEEVQWDAKSPEFRVCVSALLEDYEKLDATMREIGIHGKLSAEAYRQWPVFKLARKEKRFTDCYRDIFGKEMVIDESAHPVTQESIVKFFKDLEQSSKSFDSDEPTNSAPSSSDDVE